VITRVTPGFVPTAPTQRPWSCDTFVALPEITADGSMLLAKNSDRPAKECQPLRYWPRRQSSAASSLRLAYLDIPDVEQSWAHLGGSPYWCWGHELGLNEWDVGIGNEALFTRDLAEHVAQSRHGQPPPAGILRMELVRLGLERATTAQEAVSTITELVAAHGQWGSGVPGRQIEEGAYDNSHLVADPREAWVIETSGHLWAARKIRSGTYAISNQPTIRTEWDQASQDLIDHAIKAGWWPAGENRPFDFARAYTDPGTRLQASHVRLQRSRHLLADAARHGKIAFDQASRVLRDHYEDTFLAGPYFTAALPDLMTLCMHDSPAGVHLGKHRQLRDHAHVGRSRPASTPVVGGRHTMHERLPPDLPCSRQRAECPGSSRSDRRSRAARGRSNGSLRRAVLLVAIPKAPRPRQRRRASLDV
jgi:secernin